MKPVRIVILCALILVTSAGCAPPAPTPTATLSPRQLTEVALTIVAVSVRQTLDAQATQSALTPIVTLPTLPPTVPVSSPTPTLPVTLTPTPSPTATPPASPTATLPPAMPGGAALAPGAAQAATLTLDSQFLFEIDRAEARTQAGIFTPRYGRFLILLGAFINQTDQRPCVYSRYFRLGYGGERYTPATEAMTSAKNYYWVDYPGPVNGQCVEPNSRAETFILFDVPASMTTFDFIYRDVNVGALTLVPRTDGAFDVQVAGE